MFADCNHIPGTLLRLVNIVLIQDGHKCIPRVSLLKQYVIKFEHIVMTNILGETIGGEGTI